MAQAQAESVVQTIIRELTQTCAVGGEAPSGNFVDFMGTCVVQDTRNMFNGDHTLTNHDKQILKELYKERHTTASIWSLDTIKMQLYFDKNYTSRREFLKEINRMLELRLNQVSREITECRLKTKEQLDVLYRKIITFILLGSGMGSPSDISSVQEATVALQSIFPPTELGAFSMLLKSDKEQQLSELTMTVTGIRLFNKAGKKEEAEINFSELSIIQYTGHSNTAERLQTCGFFLARTAVPAVLCEALSVTSQAIENELRGSQCLAWKYTALLEKYKDRLPGESDVSLVQLKHALYNVRQHELFLQILLADAGLCGKKTEILQKDISSQINLLKNSVQPKTAVSTTKVYPLFRALSKLWSELQDEAELQNVFSNIQLGLRSFLTSQAKIFSKDSLDSLLEGLEVITDRQRMNESSCERIDPAEMKQNEWLLFETTDNLAGLLVQFSGFCGYTLVHNNGLLLPGNPYIGVLRHREKLYVFSSKEAALKFARSPDHFIALVTEKAKCFPELIKLLKLHQNPAHMQPGEAVIPKQKCDSFTQTVVHPLESNIVKPYEWNEWELRRKAIKLADIRTTVTHSTQTHLSHMRRENITQTWLPKEVGCQTKRDGQTGVPRPQIFLAGLRGQRDGCVEKVDLTRSIYE
ncbi:cilia- and flagella-associated protein 206 [Dunckerocampus dactyliophorus]|uniref:cilia- and flagella-associated protein 206 n=1 Tax=Dunckerocampus dactyliophorus TaxID=161453 RepID=UPI00240760A7|nr:cilia- and flagella-associated protein 206 [Dunckerocampus dactyliophorus]